MPSAIHYTPRAEVAREALAKKRKETEGLTRQQQMTQEIQRVKQDTLRVFTELAQIPSLNGDDNQVERMTAMTRAVQEMEMAEIQAEQMGELVSSNAMTQLLIAAGYSGREAEVNHDILSVFAGEEPKLAYEVPYNDVGHVKIMLVDGANKVHGTYLGDGRMGKHQVDFSGLDIQPGQYRVRILPLDDKGMPQFADPTKLELKKIPSYVQAPIRGWELKSGKMHFSDGRHLRPITDIKQILAPTAAPLAHPAPEVRDAIDLPHGMTMDDIRRGREALRLVETFGA